jgi:hypothetical protein
MSEAQGTQRRVNGVTTTSRRGSWFSVRGSELKDSKSINHELGTLNPELGLTLRDDYANQTIYHPDWR